MTLLLAPFAVATAVLLVGGAFKVREPAPAGEMLAAVGVPRADAVARLSGPVEIALAGAAFLVGGRVLAGAVAAAFALFAVLVLVAMRAAGPVASCGCFGRLSGRPSGVHVAVNTGLAVVAAAAALA